MECCGEGDLTLPWLRQASCGEIAVYRWTVSREALLHTHTVPRASHSRQLLLWKYSRRIPAIVETPATWRGFLINFGLCGRKIAFRGNAVAASFEKLSAATLATL